MKGLALINMAALSGSVLGMPHSILECPTKTPQDLAEGRYAHCRVALVAVSEFFLLTGLVQTPRLEYEAFTLNINGTSIR